MAYTVSPARIYDELSQTVIGQEEAKRTVSIALFMHYVRIFQNIRDKDEIKKSNLLLMGPSGNGKTHLIREASKALQTVSGYDMANVLEVDCTSLTAHGWEGDNFRDLLLDHCEKYKHNEITKKSSIIFLDEIDKLCMPAMGRSGTDHNKQTQYGLLKAVEGQIFNDRKGLNVDTTEMLFVFAGNFSQVRTARRAADKKIGFTDRPKKELDVVAELEKGGMTTQLIGRISYIAELNRLNSKELMYILKEQILPEKYRTWDYLGYDLRISDYRLKKIVDEAMAKKTGARALQSTLDKYLEDELFYLEARL